MNNENFEKRYTREDFEKTMKTVVEKELNDDHYDDGQRAMLMEMCKVLFPEYKFTSSDNQEDNFVEMMEYFGF